MSRTYRNLPYHVAYRMVTGEEVGQEYSEFIDIDVLLEKARSGEKYHIRRQPNDPYCDGFMTPSTSIESFGSRQRYSDTSRWVGHDDIKTLGVATLYPMGGITFQDGIAIPVGDNSYPSVLFTGDDLSEYLMSYLLDCTYHDDAGIEVYPTQQVIEHHLVPVEFSNGEVMFVSVRAVDKKFHDPDDVWMNHPHVRTVYRVVFYLANQREIKVNRYQDTPHPWMTINGTRIPMSDTREITRLSQGHGPGWYTGNKTLKELSSSSRRASDRDDLKDMVKMANSGYDMDEADIQDSERWSKFQSWKGY